MKRVNLLVRSSLERKVILWCVLFGSSFYWAQTCTVVRLPSHQSPNGGTAEQTSGQKSGCAFCPCWAVKRVNLLVRSSLERKVILWCVLFGSSFYWAQTCTVVRLPSHQSPNGGTAEQTSGQKSGCAFFPCWAVKRVSKNQIRHYFDAACQSMEVMPFWASQP